LFAFIVTLPSAQSGSPAQPVKTYPGSMSTLNAISAPSLNDAEQLPPQLIPGGELMTVPALVSISMLRTHVGRVTEMGLLVPAMLGVA